MILRFSCANRDWLDCKSAQLHPVSSISLILIFFPQSSVALFQGLMRDLINFVSLGALRTDGRQTSSASRILSEERRRNNLLQQLREEYSKARNAPAATPMTMPMVPPYYLPPQPPTYASEPREKPSRLTDIMEAMMLQNAQVFQMMQQQMLMNSVQRPQTVM